MGRETKHLRGVHPAPHRNEAALNEHTAIQEQLLSILALHRGANQRISRTDLLAALQRRAGAVSDREMRSVLEELRRSHPRGAWICADLRGGYFMARDENELARYLGSDERRAHKLLHRVATQRKAAGLQAKEPPGAWNQ